jgi:hypothetical protein
MPAVRPNPRMYNEPMASLGVSKLRRLFDVNLIGVVICTLAVRRAMIGRPGTCILNISSSAAYGNIRGLLANSLETAALGDDGFSDVGQGPGSDEAKYIDWLTITDNPTSVVEDVTRIRNHPLVPRSIPIFGYIYDVTTGTSCLNPGRRRAYPHGCYVARWSR